MRSLVYFKNLNSLRFLAFFAVFINHCFSANTVFIKNSAAYQYAIHTFNYGEFGVSFFFVLSSYLITYLLLEEQKNSDYINIGYFYYRRILRIWPLFFLCIFLGFVVYPFFASYILHIHVTEKANPVYYLFFISNFDVLENGFPATPPLGVLWSLSIEEQFYLVWPVLILFAGKRKVFLFGFLLFISCLFQYFHRNNEYILYYHSLSVLADFAIGGCLAHLSFSSDKFRNFFRNLSSSQIILTYLIVFSAIAFHEQIEFLKPLDRILFSLLFGFIILEQNYAKNSFIKLGSVKWLDQWGKYTFGLYCLHMLAIVFVDNLFSFLSINNYTLSILFFKPVTSFALTLVAGRISYHYLELPFLQLKNRFRTVQMT